MRRSLLLTLPLSLLALASAAEAQQSDALETARRLYDQGQRDFREGRLEDGCKKVVKAHWLLPSNRDVTIDAVNCAQKLGAQKEQAGDLGAAYDWYGVVAVDATSISKPEDAVAASAKRKGLQPRVGAVRVVGGAVNAFEISVDGQTVVVDPSAPTFHVTPGNHVFKATALGKSPIMQEDSVPAGGTIELDLSGSGSSSSAGTPIWPWIVGGLGVAALGVGIGFGVDGLAAKSHLEEVCGSDFETSYCPVGYDPGPENTRKNLGLGLVVGLGTAGVGAIVAAIVGLATDGGGSSSTGLQVVPFAWDRAAGLVVAGGF